MHRIPLWFCTTLAVLASHIVAARDVDVEALSKSSLWQVRYCVASRCDVPSADARRILERLAVDDVPQVARQAFAVYSQYFVVLDRDIVRKAFARGDFNVLGIDVPDRKAFTSSRFWIQELSRANRPNLRADAIRAIGMCGTADDIAKLSDFMETTNPYLLFELAKAFHRLGDVGRYLTAINAMLALPLKESFCYQNCAIDCLIQTHPERARPAWKQVHEQFEKSKDGQPNWVYSHIVQEFQLP